MSFIWYREGNPQTNDPENIYCFMSNSNLWIQVDPKKDVVLDVSSTSSESDVETPLQALRTQELQQMLVSRGKWTSGNLNNW